MKFSAECLASVVPSYVPIVHKHKDDDYTTKQKEWQAMRRVSLISRFFSFFFPLFFFIEVEGNKKRSETDKTHSLSLSLFLSLSLSLYPSIYLSIQGLYAEYNLVYDRGTTFGLKTAGRVESILMSLPLSARWEYCHKVEEGSPEAKLLSATRTPREWV